MLVCNWNDFNAVVKAIHYKKDLVSPPYRFFIGGDSENICILKGNGDILESYTYSVDLLDQTAKIEALKVPEQELLVYYGDKDKKPEVIVNLTTGLKVGAFSAIPPAHVERGYVLAYGKDRKLVRIAVDGGLLNSLYVEREAKQFLTGEGECNRKLFFDLKFFLEGRSMSSQVEFECDPQPEAVNVEDYPSGKQINRLQRMLYTIDEDDPMFKPLDDEDSFLLTELIAIGKVPRVDTVTPVVLDKDVKEYGVDYINVVPGGRLSIHVLTEFWANDNRIKLNTLLGHDDFSVGYTVK